MAETKSKELEKGMYECQFVKPLTRSSHKKGEKVTYHSSTAQVLKERGVIKILGKLKNYQPKGNFEKAVSEKQD